MNKFFIFSLFFALILGLAFAAMASEDQKEYTLKLTAQQIQTVGNALAAQPYGQVAPLLAEIQKQISDQDKPKKQPKGEVK